MSFFLLMYVERDGLCLQNSADNIPLWPPGGATWGLQSPGWTQSPCVPRKVGSTLRSFQQEQAEGHETEKHQEINEEERPATAMQPVAQGALFLLRFAPGNSNSVGPSEACFSIEQQERKMDKQTRGGSYLAADSRRDISASFLFSLSAFFFDTAALPLCLCRITCGGELKQIIQINQSSLASEVCKRGLKFK